ncbi:hypothetical protein BH09BAC2_BH09BAC2_02110 [soil metagenome]
MKEYYGTLSETINGLKKDGYTTDFNILRGTLVCQDANLILSPEDFKIDKTYRFEGETNPDDQSILYAISSEKFNIKGVLVNGYGISSDDVSNTLIEKLKTHP